MLLRRIFGLGQTGNGVVVEALYERIVAAARQPRLYAEWNVPDTPLGRFEMVSLHVFLFLERAQGEAGPVRALAQDLTDEFFKDVDHSLRELGIGDLGIPKRMKKLARMFYGRTTAYSAALAAGDEAALAAALARNVRPDAAEWPEAPQLARYAAAAHAALAVQPLDALLAGRIAFPDAGLIREEVQ